MTATVCPGPCNSAWRRAEDALAATGTDHLLVPVLGEPVHCRDCVHHSRQRLSAMPDLLEAVLAEATEGTPTKLTGTIGRISAPAWPGQASRLLVDRIVGEMVELGADILKLRGIWRQERQAGPGTAANEHSRFRAIAGALDAHWDWAMQHHPAAWEPWGSGNASPGAQVTAWYRTCARFTKADEQRDVRRLAPCPRCHGPYLVESRDLRLVGGRPYVECRDPDCQRVMTATEYDAYVKALNAAIIAAA